MWLFQTALVWSILPLAIQYHKNIITVTPDGGIELEGRGLMDITNTTQADLVLTTMFDLCEYYSTCNKSVPIPSDVQKLIECCVPCDCSDDCFAVGNCCKDKTGEPPRDERYVTARGESCEITNSSNGVNINRKLLVTVCHPDYTGDAAIKCGTPRQVQLPPDLFIPVYSKQTNLSYANIYCAICNFQHVVASQGTSSLVPWEATTNCLAYAPLHRGNDSGAPALPTNCEYNIIAAGLPSSNCFHLPEPLDCYDAARPKVCSTFPGRYGLFEGMYERICTNQCILQIERGCNECLYWYSYCATLNLDIESHMRYTNSVSSQPSFVNNPDDRDVDDLSDGCQTGHIESPDGSCVTLACCPSQYQTVRADDFHCVDIYKQVKGACLDYRLRFVQSMTSSRLDIMALSRTDLLRAELFPDRPTDTVINLASHDYKRFNSTVIIHNVQLYEVQKQFFDVKERFLAFKERLKTAFAGDIDHVELATKDLAYKTQPLDEIGYLSYANQTNPPPSACQTTIAMNDIQFCQMVTFSPRQYRVQEGVVVLSDGRQFRPHQYVLRPVGDRGVHAYVCLETYMAMGGMSGSGHLGAATRWVSMGLALFLGFVSFS